MDGHWMELAVPIMSLSNPAIVLFWFPSTGKDIGHLAKRILKEAGIELEGI
jgi:hypothetical protein